MRLFLIVVVISALVGSYGYTFLSQRADQAETEQDRGSAVVAQETVEDPRGALSGEQEAVPAPSPERAKEPSKGPARSAFYQWVDERGSVNFAASLEEVPVAWRERAGRVELDEAAFTVAKSPSSGTTLRRRPRPVSVDPPAPVHEVTVYTAPWCGWCQKTLAFLDERGVDYVNKDIEADEGYESELREKTGRTSIPLVEIDGEQIRGFNAGRMAELLERRR